MRARRSPTRAAVALLAMALAARAAPGAADEPPRFTLPASLVDVSGAPIDVAGLARDHRLILITLKTTRCAVCREQLARLQQLLPRLRACDATFVVVAPGARAAVAALAAASGFPYPFVADSDRALARAADLVLGADEIEPAVLEVDAQRRVIWEQRGRGPGAFSDAALLDHLDCKDLPSA